jgi:hypothetical protein
LVSDNLIAVNKIYIGGDVSKGYCDFIVLNHKGNILENVFQLDDTEICHKKLTSILGQISYLLTKQRIQQQNYMEKVLYAYYPSLLKYWNDKIPAWLLAVLEKYPTSLKLANAKKTSLYKIPFVTADSAEKLKQDARKNPGLRSINSDRIIVDIIKQLRGLEKLKSDHISILKTAVDKTDLEILISFPGIDVNSAIGLLVEIGDIRRFESFKQLVGLFGVNPDSPVSSTENKKRIQYSEYIQREQNRQFNEEL